MNAASNPFDLTGRRALVTGASRGIGLAVAEALGRCGAQVAITGRKAAPLEEAGQKLRAAGIDTRSVVCNQGDPQAIGQLFDQLDAAGFAAEIMVINAATNPVMGPLLEIDVDAWRKILDVNLTGAMLTARAAVKRMVPKQRGSVLFMASVAGIDPLAGLGAYSVSKAGVLGLAKVLAKELGPLGIRVNALAPGLVETRFAAALFQDKSAYEKMMAQVPLGRHGQPGDIAGAAVFLSSDAAAHITGQVLVIDGGARV